MRDGPHICRPGERQDLCLALRRDPSAGRELEVVQRGTVHYIAGKERKSK